MNFHTTALYAGFIIGNLLHILMIAYQLVQVRPGTGSVSKHFPSYSAFLQAFAVPIFVRTVFMVLCFGILLQNPGLTNWAMKPLASYFGNEFTIQLTGLSACMLGFMCDAIVAVLVQRYGSKYPWLVAQIPTIDTTEDPLHRVPQQQNGDTKP